jgi:hypothetical protein
MGSQTSIQGEECNHPPTSQTLLLARMLNFPVIFLNFRGVSGSIQFSLFYCHHIGLIWL